MRVLRLERGDLFQARDGSYVLSFIPNLKTGKNVQTYSMHWVKNNIMFESFPCLGKTCPICNYAKTLASEDARQWLPKNRVLINVWEDDSSKAKVWDSSAWLITKGFGTEGALLDSRLWDTSKYGIILGLDVRKRGPYPEYKFFKSLRRFEIPPAILKQARDLQDLITVPAVDEVEDALDNILNTPIKIDVQRTESVGEVFTGKRKTDIFERVTKANISATQKKKKTKFQEPEPYKRGKRIIIMEE